MIIISIVELIGFPGCGKTYLLNNINSDEVFAMDENEFYKYCNKIKKAKKLIEFLKILFFYFDVVICLLIFAIFYCKPLKYSLKKVYNLLKYLSIYTCILELEFNNKIVVFDQGYVQELWSMCFFTNNSLKENIYLNHVIKRLDAKLKVTYIYYNVDFENAAMRAKKRNGLCIIDGLEYNEIYNIYDVHRKDYCVLKKYLTGTKFYIIENSKEYCSVINSIKENGYE